MLNPLYARKNIVHHLSESPDINYNAEFIDLKTTNTNVNSKYENIKKFIVIRHPFEKLIFGYRKQVLNANIIRKISMMSQYANLKPKMSFKNLYNGCILIEKMKKFVTRIGHPIVVYFQAYQMR